MFLRPRVTGRERNTATDDGVGAEGTGVEPLEVHRTTAAARVALRESEDLGEGAQQHCLRIRVDQLGQVHPLGVHERESLAQELVVSAVRSVDRVGGAQGHGRTDSTTLLTDARVGGTVNETFTGEFKHSLFKGAHEVHLAEEVPEQLGICRLVVGVGRFELDPRGSGFEWRDAGHVVRSFGESVSRTFNAKSRGSSILHECIQYQVFFRTFCLISVRNCS